MHPGSPAEPVLAAWGITTGGKPAFIGLAPGSGESTDAWAGFLTDLKDRGLASPLLIISDGALDLETCCHGPVEFDLAHVPEDVSERYADADGELLSECRVLVLAMVAAWRWDPGTNSRTGNRQLVNSSALYARAHRGRRSTS